MVRLLNSSIQANQGKQERGKVQVGTWERGPSKAESMVARGGICRIICHPVAAPVAYHHHAPWCSLVVPVICPALLSFFSPKIDSAIEFLDNTQWNQQDPFV